ncbi:hypothetical protein SLEP1_g55130 [Rubroshorea leprosula]|uniref:Uncharacterized protein n=1 Tax=Rubroshorea leprosula TaxID=152421 RepID=A0AAV5MEG9_9ROSI|nr:hypothetical protein SLEP1_g55130 [Rubroshorea leprosula]
MSPDLSQIGISLPAFPPRLFQQHEFDSSMLSLVCA